MFRDVTLGQYYNATSFLHNMDSRAKLVLNLFYLIGIFFISSFFGYGIILVFLTFAIIASRVPIGSILKSLRGIIFIIVFASLLNLFFPSAKDPADLLASWWVFEIYGTALIHAAQITLRLVFLVVGSSLLTLTTTPVDLTHGIESLLYPLTWIKVPVEALARIMSLALSFIPTLIEETDRIIKAQKSRGASFDTGGLFARAKAFVPILIPLLVSSFRRADELALAMNSRCYEGATKRTQMRVLKFSWRDLIGALITVIFFTAVFVLYTMEKSGSLPYEWMCL